MTIKSVTIEVRIPPPAVTLSADPETIISGGSSTLSWKSEHGERAVLEPGIGSVALNGTWQVQPEETTTYTITVTGPGGVATATVTVSVISPMTIEITEPSEGAAIFRPDVMVRGTVSNTDGAEVGVNVNGVLALVEGNQFVANHVPLEEGENSILAQATTQGGETASTQIMVHGNRQGDYVRITAEPEAGVSPLEINLTIEGSFSFETSSLSYTGPGTVEVLSDLEPSVYTVSMTAAGVYTFTVEVVDNENNVHSDAVTVFAMDGQELDRLLKEKWNGMKAALTTGDVQKSLGFFQSGSRSDYEEIFSALGTRLPGIAAEMREIEPIYLEGKLAKYRIKREESVKGQKYDITYYVYFLKDSNGLWQIESF
jgi:hypothetical protein